MSLGHLGLQILRSDLVWQALVNTTALHSLCPSSLRQTSSLEQFETHFDLS